MNGTHERAGRLLADPEWRYILAIQWGKGLAKYAVTVDQADLTPAAWADHAAQEAADGCVYALRVSDTGHPIRGRLAAFLFALAARLLLPIR